MTSRALLLAALADGPSVVRRPLHARDTSLMVGALRALGVGVVERSGDWYISPAGLQGGADIDCGLAGTVMRFVPPAAALADGPVHFDGDIRARERPIGEVLAALRMLGVQVVDSGVSALPFDIVGTGRVQGGTVRLDSSASSQFVSALLLAGARYDAGVDVRHVGPPVPSRPHIDMTVRMLRARGVVVDATTPDRWVVDASSIRAVDVDVEPDLSTAAPFLAAALVTGGTVTVPGWPPVSDQAGDRLLLLLRRAGADVVVGAEALVVRGAADIHGLDVDLHDVGELTPVLAAVCALADSPSYLRGIAHLRGHETDRLAALATELVRLGTRVEELEDGLRIHPRPLRAALFRTHGDHRMAQAAAVLALAVPGLEVDDVTVTTKTHPDFVGAWESMLHWNSARSDEGQ